MRDNGERVPYQRGVDGLHVRAVQIRVLHVVEQRVAPVQPVGREVHGQSVGPAQRDVAEHDQIRTVRVRATDVGRPVPFREEYVSEKRYPWSMIANVEEWLFNYY